MGIIRGSEIVQLIVFTIVFFVFWLLLSGLFTVKHLTIGAITSVSVAWITRSLLKVPSAKNPNNTYSIFQLKFHKLFIYFIWLFKEIVKSNSYMAKLVLNPKMPIEPVIVTFKQKMDNPLGHALLGTSIALTPGTLTIDIDDDCYLIHSITTEMGATLAPSDDSESQMVKKVAAIFDEPYNPQTNKSDCEALRTGGTS